MTKRAHSRPTATLLVQVMGLVVISLVLAQALNLFMVFRLPRPIPEYFTVAEIAQAFEHRQAADENGEARPMIPVVRPPTITDPLDQQRFRAVREELAGMLGVAAQDIVVNSRNYQLDTRSVHDIRNRLTRVGQREMRFLVAPFDVSVRQADGRWLTVTSPRPRFPSPWQMRILWWFVLTAVAMLPVAWWFARRLSTSVQVFAEAAERLGRDPTGAPLQLKGPSEIEPAIAAFNQMQDRLRRYVGDRTAMAAAMAHDLRTPLTRLRFRVEAAPPELRDKLAADMDEMDQMITATLAYVRDSAAIAEHKPLELSSLLESVVDDLSETGKKVTIDRAERVVLNGDPVGLRRLLTNLIENACKFGGSATSRLYSDNGAAVIEIEDQGPGVFERDLEKVFEPFYRSEPSRSRETGGTGLGLAAVRTIAQAHGGEAKLRNLPERGLLAQVRLPL